MEDSDGTSYEMIMIRNPWKESYYEGDWDQDDDRWTNQLVS